MQLGLLRINTQDHICSKIKCRNYCKLSLFCFLVSINVDEGGTILGKKSNCDFSDKHFRFYILVCVLVSHLVCIIKSSQVCFIVNSATCTGPYIKRIEIALLSDPWCIQLTLNTDSRRTNTDKYSLNICTYKLYRYTNEDIVEKKRDR